MLIKLTKDDDGVINGYQFIPEDKEDKMVLGSIRHMHFFGLDETELKYQGIETKEDYVTKMSFIMKKDHPNYQ